MPLSHALPAAPFVAPGHRDGRRPMHFASPVEATVPVQPPPATRSARRGRRERWLVLALVSVAHIGALVGIARLARAPAVPPEVPVTVALIELPVPLPPVAAPPPPEPKPVAPRPKVAPAPAVRVPPRAPDPAPRTDAASAIDTPAKAPPAPETPRETATPAPTPVPAATPQRAPVEAPPVVVAARFDAAYLNNPAPAYPPLSRRMREEGKVMLRVHVSTEGLPNKVELAESSGFGRLDNAARESVERWRFVPAKQDGRAVDAWVIVPVVFKLEGN